MTAGVALSLRHAAVTAPRLTFADAVREHQDEVYGVALRITGDRDAALDVASATFLKAYRAFHRYDPSRPIRYWLLRIATNEAISHARRATRELRRRTDMDSANDLAARAQARVPFAPATLVSAMVAGVSAAILVATGAIAFSVLAPTLLAEGLAGAIALAARIAVPMDGVIRQLQEPTMPIAAIAGLAMAIAYEFRQRRERLHVLSST